MNDLSCVNARRVVSFPAPVNKRGRVQFSRRNVSSFSVYKQPVTTRQTEINTERWGATEHKQPQKLLCKDSLQTKHGYCLESAHYAAVDARCTGWSRFLSALVCATPLCDTDTSLLSSHHLKKKKTCCKPIVLNPLWAESLKAPFLTIFNQDVCCIRNKYRKPMLAVRVCDGIRVKHTPMDFISR